MIRKRVKKYDVVNDIESDAQIDEVTQDINKLRKNKTPNGAIGNVSRVLNKMSSAKIVTAADLGRMAADMLVKEAKLTIMSRTVPASESQDAHKDIMEGRGAAQTPHRYGRKPQQPKSDAE